MRGLRLVVALPLLSPAVVACGSTTPTQRPSASPTSSASASPSASATGPVATPTATPGPSGPFAVIYTNDNSQGTSYDVLLVSAAGVIVAKTEAQLPTLKSNQTLSFSPVAAGATHAYYLDGNSDIRSLAPDGTTALAKTVPGASTAEMAFAISPDESRVAVALINESEDTSNTTDRGYVEDLADANNHVGLFNNTGADAYRWPVAWFGNDIIDQVGMPCSNYGNAAGDCENSYHSINAANGNRIATICEMPNPEPYGYNDVRTIEGNPVAAGVTCYAYTSAYGAGGSTTCSLNAVSWAGAVSRFDECPSGESYISENSCFLSPNGVRMACLESSNQALAILTPSGHLRSLGRKYSLLGWFDGSHMMVEVDSSHLAIVDVDDGTSVTVELDGADHAAMAGVIGG